MRSLILLLAVSVSAVVYVVSLGLTARLVASTAAALSSGGGTFVNGGPLGGGNNDKVTRYYYTYTSTIVPTGTTITKTSTYSSTYTIRHLFDTSVDLYSTYRYYTDTYTVYTGDSLPSTAAYFSSISFTPQYSTLYSTSTYTYTYNDRRRSQPTPSALATAAPSQVIAAPIAPPQVTAAPPPSLYIQHAAAPVLQKRVFRGDPWPRLRAILALSVLMLVCYAALLANGVVCSIAVQRAEQRVESAHADAARITTPAAYDDVRSAIHKRSSTSKSFAAAFAALTFVLLVLGLATFVLLGVSFGIVGGLAAAAVALWALSIVAGIVVIGVCLLDVRSARNEHSVVGPAQVTTPYDKEKQSSVGHGEQAHVAPAPLLASSTPAPSVPVPAPAPPAASSSYHAAGSPAAGTMYMSVSDGRGGTVLVPVQQSV